jgi:hypothetical protein
MANPRIEGTHRPTNKAPSLSPLNHISSEKIKVISAKINKIESVLLSLFNIIFYFMFLKIQKNKIDFFNQSYKLPAMPMKGEHALVMFTCLRHVNRQAGFVLLF